MEPPSSFFLNSTRHRQCPHLRRSITFVKSQTHHPGGYNLSLFRFFRCWAWVSGPRRRIITAEYHQIVTMEPRVNVQRVNRVCVHAKRVLPMFERVLCIHKSRMYPYMDACFVSATTVRHVLYLIRHLLGSIKPHKRDLPPNRMHCRQMWSEDTDVFITFPAFPPTPVTHAISPSFACPLFIFLPLMSGRQVRSVNNLLHPAPLPRSINPAP